VLSFLKLILAAVFMAAILFIAVLNMDERVTVHLSPARAGEYRNLSLALVLFITFLLGMVAFALVSLVRDLRAHGQIRRLKKENRRLLDELHQLRSVTLDDLPRSEELEEED
jgi:uncharacterized integral membrane protein